MAETERQSVPDYIRVSLRRFAAPLAHFWFTQNMQHSGAPTADTPLWYGLFYPRDFKDSTLPEGKRIRVTIELEDDV